MTDLFTKQFAEMFKASPYTQFQNPMMSFMQDGISKTQDATLKSIEAAKDGAEALSKTNSLAANEACALSNKAFDQMIENTQAAFAAFQALALAKSPMEVAKLQAEYVQAQMAKAGVQTKELFELSTKLAQKTAEATTSMAAKTGKF